MNHRENNMLSLYIHIPFCVKKCPYCGFYSTPYSPDGADGFLAGLRLEMERHRSAFQDRPFNTLYVGGGTPTVLSPGRMEALLNILDRSLCRAPDAEFTVEANPNTVTGPLLELLRQHGANRLSIGVQSFSDEQLRTLGRAHTAGEAGDAVLKARCAGFQNIGIDLIYGAPGQSVSRWRETLERALSFSPEHISTYSLSLDEGSAFRLMAEEGSIRLPDDETAARMYETAAALLADAGYIHYELSNFARPGFECRHNLNYWDRGEYLGLGPGAWSFLEGKRRGNIPDVHEYSRRLAAGLPVISQEDVPAPEQARAESLLLGLRTARGVDLRRFQQLYGRESHGRLLKNLRDPLNAGLLQLSEDRICLTGPGRLLADEAILKLCL